MGMDDVGIASAGVTRMHAGEYGHFAARWKSGRRVANDAIAESNA